MIFKLLLQEKREKVRSEELVERRRIDRLRDNAKKNLID
jgi:hypothetical protein